MRMLALITDALREIYARKVIIGIVIIEVVALTITAFILFSDGMQRSYRESRLADAGVSPTSEDRDEPATDDARRHDDSLLGEFGSSSLDTLEFSDTTSSQSLRHDDLDETTPPVGGDLLIEEVVKSQLGAFAIPTLIATLFLGIFATAGIVPSMMEKGTIDLLLSKPLPRWKLLWGRAAGGVLAVAVNLALFTIALWCVYGMASGVWYAPFIWITWTLSFSTFLVLYSGVIALNVTTDSWVLPMSLAYVHMVILSNFLSIREETIFQWVDTPIVRALVDGLYYALPQTNDIANITGTSVLVGSVTDWTPLLYGVAFAATMIAFSTWRFSRRDF